MPNEVIVLIIIAICYMGYKSNRKENNRKNTQKQIKNPEIIENNTTDTEIIDYSKCYKPKWLFSYNEKTAYNNLKKITDELGLHLLSKVRLLDLVEPQKGNPKYKTLFYKVQAKHVDFVICTNNLVAKCIVELDDQSHQKSDRIQRDKFVDEILKSVGYEIIHTNGINETTLKPQLTEMFMTKKQGN